MAMMIRGHKSKIAEGDIPIAGVRSSRIYSDVTPFKRASDLMIHWNEFVFKVMPEDIVGDGFRLASIPVVPTSEIQSILRKREGTNYVHWGALSISIDALFKKNAGVTGQCYVFDKRWTTFDQALLQKFEFNLDRGSATMITSPNFSVSLDDPGLMDSICVAVLFENLNFRLENYPISVRVGNMCRFFDSFLSAVRNKDESNAQIEALNAEPLGLADFGFDGGDRISELFDYVQSVPVMAVQTKEMEMPKGLFGLMGKRTVKSFEFTSKAGNTRRRDRSKLKISGKSAGVKLPAFEDELNKIESGAKGKEKLEAFGRAGSVSSEGSLVSDISAREFQFARQNQEKEDGRNSELATESGRRIEGLPGGGQSSLAWKDRGNSGTDTGVHLRKHRGPRNIRANGVSRRGSRSENEWESHSAAEVQPEDSSGTDQAFPDHIFGQEHQYPYL
ncbi:movement protein [Peach chlorotic leaf spot virus]|uniref:Movement protein n=1 Tax=Peach chlorotic leaf spot virus TaxID=2358294 RepID=A0AAD0WW95_9VIRU|nr:movement protein [Peach chlorotic leaf spot virus]AYA62501.1 movement protein [Peach chlorotic leaf spot virus]